MKQLKHQGRKLYWIYLVIAIIGISITCYYYFFCNSELPKEITWHKLKVLFEKHEVEKIVVQNKTLAEVFIKPEALVTDTAFLKFIQEKNGNGIKIEKGPLFCYKITSDGNFESEIRELEQNILTCDTVGKPIFMKQKLFENVQSVPITYNEQSGNIKVNKIRNFDFKFIVFNLFMPIIGIAIIWLIIMQMIIFLQILDQKVTKTKRTVIMGGSIIIILAIIFLYSFIYILK